MLKKLANFLSWIGANIGGNNKNPSCFINLLIIKDDKICLAKRTDFDISLLFQNLWGFIDGAPKEVSLKTSAQRVLWEGLGLLVQESRIEFLDFCNKDKESNIHYYFRIFLRPGEYFETFDENRYSDVKYFDIDLNKLKTIKSIPRLKGFFNWYFDFMEKFRT